MSVQGITWAYKQDARAGPKFVLVTLANVADKDGVCYPSQKWLADETGQGERSVRRHLDWLEKAGLISRATRRRDDGSKRSDIFYLNWADTEAKPGTGDEHPGDPHAAKMAGCEGDQAAKLSGGHAAKMAGIYIDTKQALHESKGNTPEFEAWWSAYPRSPNMSKATAFSAFQKARRDTPLSMLTDGLAAYRVYLAAPENRDWLKPCHAATWLNQRRWEGFLLDPPDPELTEEQRLEIKRNAGLIAA